VRSRRPIVDNARVPISIRAESETHERIADLGDISASLPQRPNPLTAAMLPLGRPDDYPFLASIDPYGNTCFNGKQTNALLLELSALAAEQPQNESIRALARAIEVLVGSFMHKPHRYLWFIGD
jgi:hypothetical protein